MTLKVGDKLPAATFKRLGENGPEDVSGESVFAGKTVVLFAVPGAFTPTCHLNHLPGFIKHAEDIKAKGVDEIAVVSVNDMFVMDAWSKTSGGNEKITFLADGLGEFTKAIGMEFDGSGAGLGLRSKRYALVAKDGVVSAFNVEDAPGSADVSTAEAILELL
ncbi:peroxiredoxin [Polycladidibacter hongkongensis]|uniref:peroxiredoxin n=1 Tax=Polycladidibacter hongkongensis TaxID=1647556 RepID=UPI00083045F6|nr:peroxiredoxin [Pseudovibrio hongkongensis]